MNSGARRLKVLFVTASYPSEDHTVDGAFVREHALAVSQHDDVVVMHVSKTTKKIQGLYSITDSIEDGIRTVRARYRRVPVPKVSYPLWLYLHWKIFRQLRRDGFSPDVIHGHIYLAGLAAVLLGWPHRIPVVLTEHSSAFPRNLMRRFHVLLVGFAMRRARFVLPVSQSLQRSIEAYGIGARFRIVPNAVATDLFYPCAESESTDPDQRIRRLLIVALLTPVKGIPCLLEALVKLREKRQDFILGIVGDGEGRAEYEALTFESGLSDVVRFHGLKSKAEVAEFMRRCDVFVLPSLFETFGVVVIEALASGKPVVVSNVGGLREIVTEEVGCLVPPNDPEALMYALDWMLDHYQDYSMETLARYAREKYSREVVGKTLHGVYLEALG